MKICRAASEKEAELLPQDHMNAIAILYLKFKKEMSKVQGQI